MNKLNLWDETNLLVKNVYDRENYKVTECQNTDLCYIFFSSNGIFYPNTVQEFENKIIIKNRFEWENLAAGELVRKNSGRQIFVRDIYKQWYIKGINSRINTIDKLIELLRDLTVGYDIITVGISSGGYMAALIGAKLNAKMCFDFSGQVNLHDIAEKNPFLRIEEGDATSSDKTRYYDITDIIENSKCQLYYFYASECQEDKKIWETLKDFGNTHGFGFKNKIHAVTMFVWNMPYIISMDEEKMQRLSDHYVKKIINPFWFSFRTMPMREACLCPIRKVCRLMRKKLGKKQQNEKNIVS